MRVSVGNIPQELNEDELKKIFAEFGSVDEVHIKRDKKTNTSLGYGHVDMKDEDAEKAIEKLNGKEIEGKALAVVNAEQLQKDFKDKNWEKNQSGNTKINGSKATSGFGGANSAVRRSGGGGRGK